MPKTLTIACWLALFWVSCSKDKESKVAGIPYVPINVRVNVNDPLYNNLQNVGGWTYYQAGSRGLILYRESTSNVRAFERQCTYDPQQVCSTLDMNAAVLQAEDNDCCGSVFSITTGQVVQGPAVKPLVEYTTQFDGTFVQINN